MLIDNCDIFHCRLLVWARDTYEHHLRLDGPNVCICIVNNESSEIIRMLNTAFNDLPGVKKDIDLYPQNLQKGL